MSEILQVIFLGTGGGAPSGRRYLPAVALRRGGGWYLFDAGEGVQMRLRESPLGWGGLQAVFISHLHGDHILGLPGLLLSLGMARMTAPLPIYGPPGLQLFLDTMLSTCRVQLPFPLQIHSIEQGGGTLLRGPDFQVDAEPLRHRIPCYGFSFREAPRTGRFNRERAVEMGVPPGPLFGQLQAGQPVRLQDGREVLPVDVMGPDRRGRSVAYCTDTAPCEAAVTCARGADLLIHDSTFGSECEAEARASGHSTAAQAAIQANTAGCRQLALTHISARYEDASPLLLEAQAIFPAAFLARDLLQVDIPALEEEMSNQ